MNPVTLIATGLVATILNPRAATPDFTRDIQPILADHCFHCHGQDNEGRKGGLRLDMRDAAFKGGKSGAPAIVPGRPDQSALLMRILAEDDEVMPPPKRNIRWRLLMWRSCGRGLRRARRIKATGRSPRR